MPNGTNIIFLVHPYSTPKGKKLTHMHLVVSLRPLKSETQRVRVTIGGDHLEHKGFTYTIATTLTTVKIHLNRTMPTPDTRHINLDIEYYYYGTPMH